MLDLMMEYLWSISNQKIKIYLEEPAKMLKISTNGIKTINSFWIIKFQKKFRKSWFSILNVFAHNKNIKKLAFNLISMLKQDGTLVIEVQYLVSMLKKLIW